MLPGSAWLGGLFSDSSCWRLRQWARSRGCWSSTPPIFLKSRSSSNIVPARLRKSTTTAARSSDRLPCSAVSSSPTTIFLRCCATPSSPPKTKISRSTGVSISGVQPGPLIATSILAARAQGASTLTMQLARNLFLSPERTFHRKIQEILLSIQIERRFTKPQIFTLYANQIFLGHGVYGFEAGSEYYFSKHAKDLTLEEAALLAGLPKSPSGYSPINYPEKAVRRRNIVINNMLEDGKITAEEAMRAKNAPLRLRIQSDPNSLAPYFVEEVRRYLEKKVRQRRSP